MIRKRLGLCGAAALVVAPPAIAQQCIEGTRVWTENVAAYGDGDNIITGQACYPNCPPGFRWEAWEEIPSGEGATADAVFGDGPNGKPGGLSIKVWGGRPTGSDDLVHTYHDLMLNTGLWMYATDLYVPSTATGESHFVLLNRYESDGEFETENWSTQVRIDTVESRLVSDFDGGIVPLQLDAWRRLETIISFDEDFQLIRYDGRIFSLPGKTWTGGVSGGGLLTLAAVNLYANGADAVYYDGFEICAIPPVGGCCFRGDPCVENLTREECESLAGETFGDPGTFQGIGSVCGGCRFYGANGWEISDLLFSAPPFRWFGNTCDDFPGIPHNPECETDPSQCSECDLAPSQDQAWSFAIPWDGTWTFSTCGAAGFDTQIFASTMETCDFDLPQEDWSNDDCERIEMETDSELAVPLSRGSDDVGDVFITLEGVAAEDCGFYILSVGSPCPPLELGEDMEIEGPCKDEDPDIENIGCNADPEDPESVATFTDIACGETFSGTVGNFVFDNGHRRDLDWFRLDLPSTMNVLLEAVGNYPQVVVILAELNDAPGEKEDECTNAGNILVSNVTGTCVDGKGARTEARVSAVVGAGRYAPIVSTAFVDPALPYELGGVPCGSPYELTVTCGAACDPKSGDNDGDGCVGFSDVLAVLSNWEATGAPGIPGDGNCDGEVSFADILLILATWGAGCP